MVLQHTRDDPLGALEPRLSAEVEIRLLELFRGDSGARDLIDEFVAEHCYDGVVALGGPMGVYDHPAAPYLLESIRFLRDALELGVPVLGLCLGAQLMAHALGCPVFPGLTRSLPPEVGYLPLQLTAAGLEDPVAKIFGPPDPVMLWHQDTHDLPEGAVLLASTNTYEVQAYRLRDAVYGLQFHPEAVGEGVEAWVAEDRTQLQKWGVDCDALLDDARRYREVGLRRADTLAALFASWAAQRCAQRQSG